MNRRRVVVTGLGIVSPIGNTVAEAWENALAGKSGITRITRCDASPFNSQIAGEVKGFEVGNYLAAKEARRFDTFIHYGMAAGLQAWRDGGGTIARTERLAQRSRQLAHQRDAVQVAEAAHEVEGGLDELPDAGLPLVHLEQLDGAWRGRPAASPRGAAPPRR